MLNLAGVNWKIKDIKAVIFDKDGTIIDSHLYWGAIIKKRSRALIKEFGIDRMFYEDICLVMGYSLKEKKLLTHGPIALVSREKVIKILVNYFKTHSIKTSETVIANIFVNVHKDFLKVIYKYIKILPRAKNVLIKIKRSGVKTALITSDSTTNAEAIVSHLGLKKYFDLVTGRELAVQPKVSGVPAVKVCKILNVRPKDTVCVGDAPMDILMARKAKLKACIAVALGQTPYLELSKKTKYLIKNFTNLKIN
ncbi:MAG: putative phosphatase [Candidatus Magasanikbacteria bacterium GW2011_GWA2_37_8]|uniref:Putative phosphatase n=1 Tax=Candidatus Magasanikbacteria bacterium GW2011_GWA2_37_8 TaxID=1619036 RepID=A0A0G0JUS6_9BACT|nr:MAG: putative phosphatase [Candidatus Magasanikbacteria bacterium GW2011_GWA2_37_8]